MPTFAKNKIPVILIYCMFLCVFFEIASRLFIFRYLDERKDISCDTASRLYWIRQYQKTPELKGFVYKFDVFDPTKGWSLKPNLRNITIFRWALDSNSKGIRGKIEYNYDKPLHTKRILILGDSFTFGDEVNDSQTYSYYLQQILPHSEVINFGIHGYGHDQMLIYLKEEGIKYNPDIVILGFVYGDIYRNILEFNDYSKPKFVLIDNELRLKNSPVPPPEVILKKAPYESKFIDLLNILYCEIRKKVGLEKRNAEKITVAILDEIVKTINSINATPVFIYLPIGIETLNLGEDMTGGEKYLFSYCRDKGVYFISARPYFAANLNKGIEFNARRHYNWKIHKIVAEVIKEYLFDKNLLK